MRQAIWEDKMKSVNPIDKKSLILQSKDAQETFLNKMDTKANREDMLKLDYDVRQKAEKFETEAMQLRIHQIEKHQRSFIILLSECTKQHLIKAQETKIARDNRTRQLILQS